MAIIERERDGVVFQSSQLLDEIPGLAHGFSTRLGGVSTGVFSSMNLGLNRGDDPENVRENYRRFLSAIDARGRRFAMLSQVHGDTVRPVTTADVKEDLYGKPVSEGDAMVTAIPGVALVVFFADCIPILLCDPVRRVIGAVHAGWRGTAAGVAVRAVEKMELAFGCKPSDIRAAIGPGICPDCFETHEDVPNAMMAAVCSPALPYIKLLKSGKFSVDLKGINAKRLELAGLEPAHIEVSGACTACLSEKYWSHRKMGGQRGSMAALIELA